MSAGMTSIHRSVVAGEYTGPTCVLCLNALKILVMTNAIKSLNSVIRLAIKKRKLFSTDDSPKKVICLAIRDAAKKCSIRIRSCRAALNYFMVLLINEQ